MADPNSQKEQFVEPVFTRRKETYHPVTSRDLNILRYSGLFLIVPAFCWGFYLCAYVQIQTMPPVRDEVVLQMIERWRMLKEKLFFEAIIFSILALYIFLRSYAHMKNITGQSSQQDGSGTEENLR